MNNRERVPTQKVGAKLIDFFEETNCCLKSERTFERKALRSLRTRANELHQSYKSLLPINTQCDS